MPLLCFWKDAWKNKAKDIRTLVSVRGTIGSTYQKINPHSVHIKTYFYSLWLIYLSQLKETVGLRWMHLFWWVPSSSYWYGTLILILRRHKQHTKEAGHDWPLTKQVLRVNIRPMLSLGLSKQNGKLLAWGNMYGKTADPDGFLKQGILIHIHDHLLGACDDKSNMNMQIWRPKHIFNIYLI